MDGAWYSLEKESMGSVTPKPSKSDLRDLVGWSKRSSHRTLLSRQESFSTSAFPLEIFHRIPAELGVLLWVIDCGA